MIQLSDGYVINVDSTCYTVGIPKKTTIVDKKTGESKENTIMSEAKYYSSFDGAIVGWWNTMRKKALSDFDGSLSEAIEIIQKQDEQIKQLLSNIKINNTKLTEVADESSTNASDTESSSRNRRGRKQLL